MELKSDQQQAHNSRPKKLEQQQKKKKHASVGLFVFTPSLFLSRPFVSHVFLELVFIFKIVVFLSSFIFMFLFVCAIK